MMSRRPEVIQKSLLTNAAWNTLGSIIYYACQWLITLVVVWLYDGFENAGNLALAMNISNVFYCVAAYNIRAYQVSDILNDHTDSIYIAARFITCAGAAALCAVFILIPGYTTGQMLIIMCYMLFRIVEAIVDVLHGIVHKHGRLYRAGISMTARGLIMLAAFCITGYFLNLLYAVIAMVISTALFSLIYDVPGALKLAKLASFAKKEILYILKRCFPLMLVLLIITLFAAYTRYMLERIEGTVMLGAYITATTPAITLQMISIFLVAPLMNLFADCIKKSDKAKFIRIFTISSLIIAALTLAAAAASHFLGLWGLRLLFGTQIEPYAHLLTGAVIAMGLTALLQLFNVVYSSLRDIKGLFTGCLAGIIINIAIAGVLIRRAGADGANYAMIISQAAALAYLGARLLRNINNLQSPQLPQETAGQARYEAEVFRGPQRGEE